MHYGLLKNPISGADLSTLQDMRLFKTVETKTAKSVWTSCENKSFGLPKDFMADTDFQCFCERKPKPVPTLCADYGGKCLCSGLVFQMVKGSSADEYNFFKGFNEPYAVNNVNATSSMKCSKKNFEDVNVKTGVDKVCWCDEKQKQMNAATV